MNCLCACTSSAEKSDLVAILRQEKKELQLLSVQGDMWKAGARGLSTAGLVLGHPSRSPPMLEVQSKREDTVSMKSSHAQSQAIHGHALSQKPLYASRRAPYRSAALAHRGNNKDEVPSVGGESSVGGGESSDGGELGQGKKSANPRFQRHERLSRKKKYLKALAYNAFMKQASLKAQEETQKSSDEASTDVGGFDWNRMAQKVIQKDPAMTALGRESDRIDDVYDPTEDPQNIGPGDIKKDKAVEWWSEDTLKGAKLNDQWWQHGGEDGMTG